MVKSTNSPGDNTSLRKPHRKINPPPVSKGLLSPTDRISETLFGIIMALGYTCTVSIATADHQELKTVLYGAIGCNIAWGLVDALMYLLVTITEKGRMYNISQFVRNSKNEKQVQQCLADSLGPLAPLLNPDDIKNIQNKILALPASPAASSLNLKDIKTAMVIFVYVFTSTFPLVLPFLLVEDLKLAIRLSNLTAVLIMFASGWLLGNYSGRNPWIMGFSISLVGILLVLTTIALGG